MITKNYISIENRIENAIKVFNYCFQNNLSINKAELDLGFYEGFIKKIFASNSIKESSKYNELIRLKNKYNSSRPNKSTSTIVHKVDVDKEEKYDAEWVDEPNVFLGGFLKHSNEHWVRCDDFDGKIVFYMPFTNDDGKRIWHEYHALFMNGKMIKIENRTEDE